MTALKSEQYHLQIQPFGVDDFFAELKQRLPHVAGRVVFISGGAFTSGAQSFLDEVENQRLDKPFDPTNVRDTVQRILVSDHQMGSTRSHAAHQV